MRFDIWHSAARLDAQFAPILQLANVAIVDFSGRIMAVNPPICEMLGYRADELVGRFVSDVTHPPDRSLATDLMRRAIAGEIKTYNVEKRFVRKDGSVLWTLVSGTLVCDSGSDRPQFFASLIQDIDARKTAELQAMDSENRWSFALELGGQGVWDSRIGTGKTFYSRAWKAIIGYEVDEISDAGDLWLSFIHPEDLPRVLTADRDHLAGLTPSFECEFRMRHKKGHWVWVLDKAKVIERDASGAPSRMIGTHTDISALKASQELLRKTGEQYRLLADNSTDMILRVRKSGRRVYVSPSCRRLLGFEPEEMLGIPTLDAIHPDDAVDLKQKWIDVFECDEAITLTYRMRRKDGRYIWVESISRALPAEEEKATERLLVVRDIDERVAAEQRLKDSEARYRLLAENATDMVFQLDRDLIRRYVSPACREILGYEPGDLLGIKPSSMVHPDDEATMVGVFQSLLSGAQERGSITNRILHRDGRWIWVDAELRLLRDYRTGAPTGILGSLRDASKRKEVEARLEQDNRQLASEAAKDGLTGLFNRRAFDEALDREFRRSSDDSSALGLIMIDVDRFKAFNDLYGHPAGDACLRSVSAAIQGALQRPRDFAARYGGEEFAVLLPETDENGALEVAERILRAVRSLKLEHAGASARCVTISAGAASTIPGPASAGSGAFVQTADRALYAAKRSGRDAVIGGGRVLPFRNEYNLAS